MSEPSLFTAVDTKQRLVDRVVQQITELILDDKLAPGTKLPPEVKLAESIGVSRTVLREAMQILIAKGLVETHHGVGTIVRGGGGSQIQEQLAIMLRTKGLTLDHLHQVRTILEVEIAGIAAAQATGEELDALAQLVDRMDAFVNDPVAYADIDGEFHNYLARISHNPLMVMLLDSVGDILRQVRLSVSKYPQLFSKAAPDHRLIMERVKARDVTGARRLMREHLEHAREIQYALEVNDHEAKAETKGKKL
ncbi:MAG: FadR family transcriptional regulator [Chloroflexi bacterium]|nr:MAG: FadR family transcriptional regulator [Chloroflexota bacterium]